MRLFKRTALALILLVLLPFGGWLGLVWLHQKPPLPSPEIGSTDSSRLSQGNAAQIIAVPSDAAAAETQLVALVREAAAQHRHIAISGAQHSMGGHTLYPGGLVVNMLGFNRMSLDPDRKILTVGAGAKWSEVLPYLNRQGVSVEVMQSNDDFTVGGTLSANAHGWQFDAPPISSTVRSFRLLTASGEIVICSRSENPELFSLALGGYGLFGIILDAQLDVMPNAEYKARQYAAPVATYVQSFERITRALPDVRMTYGRISISPASFLEDGYFVTFTDDAAHTPDAVLPGEPPHDFLRFVFDSTIGSRFGKWLRWGMETHIAPFIPFHASRNEVLNETSSWFENRDPDATEILHEYFIPPENFAGFLAAAKPILRAHKADLLNVTVRKVGADKDTFLPYARSDVFALVMLFRQQRSAAAEDDMRALTRQLIEAALDKGGTYYLPYRPHATLEEFKRSYPTADRFFALKLKYDPQLVFENQFYLNYGPK